MTFQQLSSLPSPLQCSEEWEKEDLSLLGAYLSEKPARTCRSEPTGCSRRFCSWEWLLFFVFLQVEITLQDVNDNPPVFPNDLLDVTVEENVSDGFKIMQLTATDADEVKSPRIGLFYILSVRMPI